jgi:hypothetical protein
VAFEKIYRGDLKSRRCVKIARFVAAEGASSGGDIFQIVLMPTPDYSIFGDFHIPSSVAQLMFISTDEILIDGNISIGERGFRQLIRKPLNWRRDVNELAHQKLVSFVAILEKVQRGWSNFRGHFHPPEHTHGRGRSSFSVAVKDMHREESIPTVALRHLVLLIASLSRIDRLNS